MLKTIPKLPKILKTDSVAKTQCFHVESLDLEFSNGESRRYERLCHGKQDAVLVIPLNDDNSILLVQEYAAGLERYELGFPKGQIEADESPLQAANREMMEEVGVGAHQLSLLKTMTVSPAYMTHRTHIVLAQALYPKKIPGDEPEPIQVVSYAQEDFAKLLQNELFSEARSIAALFLVMEYIQQKG